MIRGENADPGVVACNLLEVVVEYGERNGCETELNASTTPPLGHRGQQWITRFKKVNGKTSGEA